MPDAALTLDQHLENLLAVPSFPPLAAFVERAAVTRL